MAAQNASVPHAAPILARVPHAALHRRSSSQFVVLGVLALHALLLLGMANLGVWRDRGARTLERPPLQVWLLNKLQAATATSTTTAPTAAAVQAKPGPPPAPRATTLAPLPKQPASEPQAITVPALPAETLTAPATREGTAAPESAPGAAEPRPLNLSLPRGASAPWRSGRNAALDDSSARSARATFEGRFARETGGEGTWVEERIDTDRIRFRRGGTCVDMERSRAGTLDPFNNAYSAKPWVAKQPREC
jgi:hypothetical protein